MGVPITINYGGVYHVPVSFIAGTLTFVPAPNIVGADGVVIPVLLPEVAVVPDRVVGADGVVIPVVFGEVALVGVIPWEPSPDPPGGGIPPGPPGTVQSGGPSAARGVRLRRLRVGGKDG